MAEKQPQPGKVSYFFGKGYTDLGNTIKDAWSGNMESAKDQLGKASEKGFFTFGGGINLIAAICIFVYGSVISIFTTLLHIVILELFFLSIYFIFVIIWLIDRIFIYINKIKNACPNPSCQASFLLPTYECPGCGAKHTKLVPGKYGILKRRCLCGAKLPTTCFNGRGKLTAFCPICGLKLKGDTGSRQYAIPVVGGPSVGKTCYINMTIDRLINSVAPARRWDLTFITEENERDYKNTSIAMKKGVRPSKTEYDALTAYQMMITLPNEKVNRRVYFYDISGEMFSSSDNLLKNNAFNFCDGFIFLIDPLSIAQYAMEMQDKININSYGISTKDFDDILNIMLINLEKMSNLKSADVFKRNLAVVINKTDIPGLEEKIGDTAVQSYMAEHPECKNAFEAKNIVCKDFLENYESGNFVRSAESKFSQVQYFTCSALGHNKEGVPFEGKNVEAPFLWVLGQVDSSIKAS